jgi:spermidine/putrescine transport system permease protein
MRVRIKPLPIVVWLLIVFLYAPLIVVVLYAFNSGANLSWPIHGLSLRWFRAIFGDSNFSSAFAVSLKASAIVSAVSAAVATTAALVFTRRSGRFVGVIRSVALLPAMLPPLFIAISLFTSMAEFNLQPGLGPIVLGQLVVVIPFVVVVVSVRLQRFEIELEEAARDLGAGIAQTLRRVTIRIVFVAILGAALLAFAFSFDEVLITNFTSGTTTTLPIYIYSKMHREIDPSINAVATLLLVTPWLALAVAWPLLLGRMSLRGRSARPR